MSDIEKRLTALEGEVRRLQDEKEINNLMGRYEFLNLKGSSVPPSKVGLTREADTRSPSIVTP